MAVMTSVHVCRDREGVHRVLGGHIVTGREEGRGRTRETQRQEDNRGRKAEAQRSMGVGRT